MPLLSLVVVVVGGSGGATQPLSRDTRRKSAKTQQSSHAPRSGPKIKNGRSSVPTSCASL